MGSPDVLDFARLLAPIPGENPAGQDPREDFSPNSAYRAIRRARTEARQAERLNIYEEDGPSAGPPADWNPVLELGCQILADQSKDLEVAALMIEALVRRHGLAGLRDGFRLACELCERYWDHLYPLPDDEGVRTRVAPLAGLNGEDSEGVLLAPIARMPITGGRSYGPFSLADYRQAIEIERIDDAQKRARRLEQPGAVSRQMFDVAVAETPPEFVDNLLEDMAACLDAFERLGWVLEQKCGKDERGFSLAPPSSSIRKALQDCRDEVEKIYQRRPAAAAKAGSLAEVEGDGETAMVETGAIASRAVATREDAFRALLQVAEFFKRTEPHSPVAYALEQAVRWGRMTLPELLGELVQDETTREQMFKLIGIRKPQE